MTTHNVTVPLDNGFIRRECPKCEREFKWHHGPTDDRPADAVDPDVYCCPYCGETAPPTHWWTKAQLEYAQQAVAGPALREMADELNQSLGTGNALFKISLQYDEPEPPSALHEPSDMTIVQAPCHPWEPIKVAEDWREPLHCIVCGEKYAIG